jgi:hypothetical protein
MRELGCWRRLNNDPLSTRRKEVNFQPSLTLGKAEVCAPASLLERVMTRRAAQIAETGRSGARRLGQASASLGYHESPTPPWAIVGASVWIHPRS